MLQEAAYKRKSSASKILTESPTHVTRMAELSLRSRNDLRNLRAKTR